ncbi:hypothetical protein HDU76_003081 [Blyttiomyces sp. JEL0837]|nr:hypothetical protein HDU76_003081 [Blyttiomyces sp. JEL0837]
MNSSNAQRGFPMSGYQQQQQQQQYQQRSAGFGSPSTNLSRSTSPAPGLASAMTGKPTAAADDVFSSLVSFGSSKTQTLSLEDQRKLAQSQRFGSPSPSPQQSQGKVSMGSSMNTSPGASVPLGNFSPQFAAQFPPQRAASPTISGGFAPPSTSLFNPVNVKPAPLSQPMNAFPIQPQSLSSFGGTNNSFQSTSTNSNPFDDLFGNPVPTPPPQTLGMGMSSNTFQPQSVPRVAPTTTPATATTGGSASPWDLDFFEKPASNPVQSTPSVPVSDDPFDLVGLSRPKPTPPPPPPAAAHVDDFLGIFAPVSSNSTPATVKPLQSSPPSTRTQYVSSSIDDSRFEELDISSNQNQVPGRSQSQQQSRGDPVVDDFAIAKIMDMGFDAESAKTALEASGHDLDLAIDFLVKNREAMRSSASRDFDYDRDGSPVSPSSRRRSDSNQPPRPPNSRATDQTGGKLDTFDDAAAQIMAKASVLGKSVFSNAKNVFDFSKKKISEVYDKASEKIGTFAEKQSQGGSTGGDRNRDRWEGSREMDDDDLRRKEEFRDRGYSKYRDSSDDDSSDDDTPYQPGLVGKRTGQPTPNLNGGNLGQSATTTKTEKRGISFDFNSESNTFPASASASSSFSKGGAWTNMDKRGNELFKIGQYGDAEECYSAAVNSMPSEDWRIIPLLNNRASARLKTGNYNGAIADCNQVQELNSKDTKSLLRRATAYEAIEKWKDALSDYETLSRLESTPAVLQALARCRKAVQGGESSAMANDAFAQPKPAIRTPPSQAARPPPASVKKAVDKAVENLRQQNLQSEQEENEKFESKENVDRLIEKWRAGKENNLRALLSSLDSILWKDLGWVTINLSELITPQQVKVKYMKAVAKVHPDKLKPSTTVEQRMIANGIFATLNKAWDGFKESNGL